VAVLVVLATAVCCADGGGGAHLTCPRDARRQTIETWARGLVGTSSVDIAAVLAQEELLEPEVLALASVQQLQALGIPLGAALQLHRCFDGAEDVPTSAQRGSGGGSSWHTLRVTGSRPLLVDAHATTHLNASTAVVVEDGGVIHVAAGASLFILGSFSAPLQHIFVGEGRVFLKGDSAGRLYPQWWGAVADGSADADWAIQRAVDAATVPLFYNGTGPLCRHCAADAGTNGVTGTVFLPPGVYSVSVEYWHCFVGLCFCSPLPPLGLTACCKKTDLQAPRAAQRRRLGGRRHKTHATDRSSKTDVFVVAL